VLVNVIVNAPAAGAVVFELVPVQPVYCVPDPTALFLLVVMLVKSVLSAANIAISVPVVGADLAVMAVLVCEPILEIVFTKLAQLVAVTVPPALTVAKAL
jgi:hypothetical protein